MTQSIFITGGTGYMGRQLIQALVRRGHRVKALVRPGSEWKLPAGARPFLGSALEGAGYAGHVAPGDIFVALVGVAHPGPFKRHQFQTIDRASGLTAVQVAKAAGVSHFVYVSVAQPAPIMKSYVRARVDVEESLRLSGLSATVLRPWYVLGPGHWWPIVLIPLHWLLRWIPMTRRGAERLGLVTLDQMVESLIKAIEEPAPGIRVWDVSRIQGM